MRVALLLLVALLSSGCGTFSAYVNRETSKSEVPLQEKGDDAWDREHHRTSISNFTASRRAIITTTDSVVDDNHTIFCAEPPPDAMISALASDRLTASQKTAAGTTHNADLATEYRTTAQGIAQRTPLVEVYRAAIFSMCQMYANGAISNTGRNNYAELFRELNKDMIAKIDGGNGTYPPAPGVPKEDYEAAVKAQKAAEDALAKEKKDSAAAKEAAAKELETCKAKSATTDKELGDLNKKCPPPATTTDSKSPGAT